MTTTPDDLQVWPDGRLAWRRRHYPVALGWAGVSAGKREGDGATPAGRFPLRRLWYRADRLPPPRTRLETLVIRSGDAWCSTPDHDDYNRHVTLPHPGQVDPLWLESDLCDLVIEVGYNDDPPVAGLGSAIFVHLARPDLGPTAGCVALRRPDLLEIVGELSADTHLRIHAP